MDVIAHNRQAWDKKVQDGNRWTQPVSSDKILEARDGVFEILLTPTKPVPLSWFPDLHNLPTLCLASGGGQQGPLLAAAGCTVTILDNSPRQLEQDRFVAQRDNLQLETIQGDMADLSALEDETFGLIVHPCSNCFVPEILPVWRECFRVLRRGGVLMAGFCNPVRFTVEDSRARNGVLEVRYSLPHSDVDEFSDPLIQRLILEENDALEFGHTLSDQIGGQLCAGFFLTDLYEDRFRSEDDDPISKYMDTLIATRSVKPFEANL
jgi:SAM-dependent methyltransferase